MNLLFAFLLPLHVVQYPSASIDNSRLPAPAGAHSFMVSDAFAEINWQEVSGADAYCIQVRKVKPDGSAELVLEDKTVWLSFYFRLAEPACRYECRLASIKEDNCGAWTAWLHLNTAINNPIADVCKQGHKQ